MSLFNSFKKWLLRMELRYLQNQLFPDRISWLRVFNRRITADIELTNSNETGDIRFRIDFHTPYFRLPVAVEKTQIGRVTSDGLLQPASFRFFDWNSWAHMDGAVQWHAEQISSAGGAATEFIEGFSYSVRNIPFGTENLGIRLAEGVAGTVRVLTDGGLVQFRFDPGYWMLEPCQSGYKIVPISDPELMVLIVSLSEIGSGNQRRYGSAMQHLHQWVGLKLGGKSKEQTLIEFLKYVRDWGPLGMEPLFHGLGEMLRQLELQNQEHVIFEFYADNWGVRNNWHGRLLAVRILEVLATKKAASALNAIYDYVKNRSIEAEELDIIIRAMRCMPEKNSTDEMGGSGENDSSMRN